MLQETSQVSLKRGTRTARGISGSPRDTLLFPSAPAHASCFSHTYSGNKTREQHPASVESRWSKGDLWVFLRGRGPAWRASPVLWGPRGSGEPGPGEAGLRRKMEDQEVAVGKGPSEP